jgi:leucyl aminopeptidase
MTVTLHTSQSAPATSSADALVIGIIQTPDGPRAAPGAAEIAASLAIGNTDLADLLVALGATGKLEEICKIPTAGRVAAPLVVAVGLGTESGLDTERLRRAAGAAVRDLLSGHSAFRPKDNEGGTPEHRVINLALPAGSADQAEAVALGAMLGGYSFRRYRATPAADIELVLFTAEDDGAGRGRVLAEAMTLVRDLINTPPADLVPADLAEAATRVAETGGLAIQVLDESELAKEGYGGILAVGMGSVHPPRLVRLEYTHPEAAKTVVFVGK